MRRLVLLTSNYPPEATTPARRAGDVCSYLASEGWQVTVIVPAPNYPQGKVYEGYGGKWIDVTIEAGVRVVRVRPWIVPKGRMLLRVASEAYFALVSFVIALVSRADVVLGSCPFMFLGPAGYLAAALRGRRFVWEVRDLFWHYPSAAGKRTFGADRILQALMLATARRADALITTTEGQAQYFARHEALPRRSAVVPNGVSDELMARFAERNESREASVAGDSPFTVVYAGLIGFPQGLRTLIDTAKQLPEVRFHLVGDGAEKPDLERATRSLGLRNVEFPGYVSFEELLEYYRRADVLFAQLRAGSALAQAQPGKLWEYMAAGRAIVYAGEGEGANAIGQSGAGLVVQPEDSIAIAKAISTLRQDPDLRSKYAANGRDFAVSRLRTSVTLQRLGALLDEVLAG